MDVTCDNMVRPWSVEIVPHTGTKFAGGKGATLNYAFACGPVFCSDYFTEQQVQLSRR